MRKIFYGVFSLIIITMISVFAVTNNDAAFKIFFNLLNNSADTKIHSVNNVSFSGAKLNIDALKLIINGNKADIRHLTLLLGSDSNNSKEIVHHLSIDSIDLTATQKNSANSSNRDAELFLYEYFPETLVEKYSGLNIWISQLSISHPAYLKDTLIIRDISLLNSKDTLSLGFSPIEVPLINSESTPLNNPSSSNEAFSNRSPTNSQ